MFNKRKVLYSAVAVALMSGGGNVWAVAGLQLTAPGTDSSPAIIATEAVGTAAIPSASTFKVYYEFDDKITDNFNVLFTLSGGATWGANLGSSTLSCINNAAGGGAGCLVPTNQPKISLVGGGSTSDSTATFLLTGQVAGKDILSFDFTVVDKAGTLANGDGEIQLSVALETPFGNFPLETSVSDKTTTLVKSKDGLSVSFDQATVGSSKIDVSQGSTQFVSGSGTNSTTAVLGTITVSDTKNSTKDDTLSTAWSITGTTATGELFISTAPFNASVTGGSGRVFLDLTANGVYDEKGDLLAEKVTDTEATWKFDSDTVTNATTGIVTKCKSTPCSIIIEADGQTPIQAQPEAPLATSNMTVGGKARVSTGKLLHIKRNGSVCILYNIPNTAAADELSVRITNMSNKEGAVLATLRGLDGKEIFTNQTLVDVLAPNATIRKDADALKTLAGGTDWTGRAVLTLSSTIPEGNMEVYALVRNRLGGPLMNLSAGASGSGCDN